MCFRRSRASSHGVYASMIEPLGSNCKQSAMVPSTIVVIQKFLPLGIKGMTNGSECAANEFPWRNSSFQVDINRSNE
ncbi:hypothetical protein QQP08_001896 [Theobroma cacao]|nr:hypothetical protein QQP08_001896 [Theobroma cacao]